MKTWKFYAIKLENFEPVAREELGETLDAGELVYLIGPDVEGVVIAGKGIREYPQLDKAA